MTMPSIWWNIGLCVASTSSFRYTRPGAIIRIGSGFVSIAWICIGEVWVRRQIWLSSVK